MTQRVWMGGVAAAALALSGVAAAQDSQPPRQSGSNQTVTVTGCVQPATGSASGATGTTGSGSTAGAASERFLLTNAQMSSGSGSASGAAGTTGSGSTSGAGSSSAAGTGTSYILEGSSDLKNHVGHQVEVKGKIEPSSSGSGSTGSTGSATSGSSPMSGAQQRLRVESVRMVSATCPSK